MLDYLRAEANLTRTENGAVTPASTGSDCLDLFASIGGLRREREEEILLRFTRAYAENPDMAMKLLFYARDIRGGLGERRVFRIILRRLAETAPGSALKNLHYVAEFGRYDDLLSLFGTPCEEAMLRLIRAQLAKDVEGLRSGGEVSLLAKWLPSANASSPDTVRQARAVAAFLRMKESEYRKTLAALRKHIRILENNLRERDYTFDYEKQPSRSLYKYRKAFARNDGERYRAFLDRAEKGDAVLRADTLAPYELVSPYLAYSWDSPSFMRPISEEEKRSLNATWNALPDFGGEDNALAVVDTSGSMYCTGKPLAAAVALSLGMYFAERNRGHFHNHFIEFSARPRLVELKGETFADRLRYACTFNEIANTNLEAVFDLVLRTAVKHQVPQSELPARLIILSDMEFDSCVENASLSNFQNARQKYAEAGYRLPQVVFWNVASRNRQQPVTMNQQGVALVSGVTPRPFSMVAGDSLSPYALMLEVVESERYAKIAA